MLWMMCVRVLLLGLWLVLWLRLRWARVNVEVAALLLPQRRARRNVRRRDGGAPQQRRRR